MSRFLTFLSLSFLSFACVQHSSEKIDIQASEYSGAKIEVKYAKGFEIEYGDGFIKIITQSISDNEQFRDSLYLITNNGVELATEVKKIGLNINRIACQSSTYLAYLNQLDAIERVVGLCGLTYVVNHDLRDKITTNRTLEICPADQVELESLYLANPELFLVYPFGNQNQDEFSKKGITTLLIAEYLEESQLARLEWIKLFGLLVGKEEEAINYFDKIEAEYLALKTEFNPISKTFIMNLPFQDDWYMPSSNSVGVQLIEDAGLTYFYKEAAGTENKLHSKEKVWNDGVEADYWIILARESPDFDLEELINRSAIYEEFKSVKEKHVIFCNTAVSDYFVQGVIEPNIILKDLLFATGQLKDHNPQYFFLLE